MFCTECMGWFRGDDEDRQDHADRAETEQQAYGHPDDRVQRARQPIIQ